MRRLILSVVVIFFAAAEICCAQSAFVNSDTSVAAARAMNKDSRLGKDKADHFAASAFLTGAQYYALRGELDRSHRQSMQMAVAGALALGLAKEIYDGVSKTGTLSFKDFVADALGVGLAVMLMSQ